MNSFQQWLAERNKPKTVEKPVDQVIDPKTLHPDFVDAEHEINFADLQNNVNSSHTEELAVEDTKSANNQFAIQEFSKTGLTVIGLIIGIFILMRVLKHNKII